MLVPLFATTLFLSSALLFAVEPLVAKGLQPTLGGGAAVWTTAVAFFQLALVAGYLYAHLANARLGARLHAWLHVGLLAVVAVTFPLTASRGWMPPPAHPDLWLFARLAVTVGPPFVLLAATAPLVQSWFASTRHHGADDPYFLYAASNAGSMVALLAYPIAIEPFFGLALQRRLWTAGLALAVGLLALCAAASRIAGAAPPRLASTRAANPLAAGAASPAPGWRLRLRWLALAAVPSSLLLSVTSYATTDLVALPLLWVMPLAIYLLTFILAFSRRQPLSARRMVWLQPLLLVPLMAEMFLTTEGNALVLIPIHALLFFVTALVCHQTLAASRPAGDRSTEFYLWIAFGGALGGLFNVFLAPLLFRSLLEYPLGLVAAALLRPAPTGATDEGGARWLDFALPAVLAIALTAAASLLPRVPARAQLVVLAVLLAGAGTAVYSFRFRPWRFGLGLAALVGSGALHAHEAAHTLFSARSFYAVHEVTLEPPSMLKLASGNTLHGLQDRSPARRREPLTYYHRGSPIGDVMARWAGRPQRQRVGVVGLGAGTLAAYAAPGERWTFFEIDPVVVEVARDRDLFTYLRDAQGTIDVVLGDGRRSLAAIPDGAFGLLVLDAFSSDAVPVHLLTREAIALDLRKLAPGGLLAFHLSNRYLDLEKIVAGGATANGLTGVARFGGVSAAEQSEGKSSSDWVVLARSPSDLAPLVGDAHWRPLPRGEKGWTDDASSLWPVLSFRKR